MLGLSGDALSVFGIWVGAALTCAVGALSTRRLVRGALWLGATFFALAAVAVVLTTHKIAWGALLPLAYAITPPMVVGIVALMLRSEQRPAVAFIIPDDGTAFQNALAPASSAPQPAAHKPPLFDKEQKDFLLQMSFVAMLGTGVFIFLIVIMVVGQHTPAQH